MARKAATATATANPDMEVADSDGAGNTYLPDHGPIVVKELVKFAKRHETTKDAHRQATATLEDENAEGLDLFEKHKEHFAETGDGGYVYRAAGIEISIPSQKLKLKTKLTDDE